MKSIFYILLTFVGIALLALAVWSLQPEQSSNDSPVLTEVSTTSVQAATSPTLCEVMTLECLSAQPEWNPTLSAPGIERIDPSELTLFDGEYELEETKPKIVSEMSIPIQVVHIDDEFSEQNCLQRGFEIVPNQICTRYPAEFYNEFAILHADTKEVLHAYRMSQDRTLFSVDFIEDANELVVPKYPTLPIYLKNDLVRFYNYAVNKTSVPPTLQYSIDIVTGELVQIEN